MSGKTPYILVGCGDSGKQILERVRERVSKDLVSVYINSQNLDMDMLDAVIGSTDLVFLFCGAWDRGEIIAAKVICELCRRHGVPTIGITLKSSVGTSVGTYTSAPKENINTLRDTISNLIVLDHFNIVQQNPDIGEDYALNLTHELIGKLVSETTEMVDTISMFRLEDVWSYRDI